MMSEDESRITGKGKAFFDQGDQVAETGNWDYAIEMYTEGLRRDPYNMERGHIKLREVAMKRKVQGGKGPGMMEQLKRRGGKNATEKLANASYLMGKDPGSEMQMEQILTLSLDLEFPELTKWIGEIMIQAQTQSKKPSKRVYITLTDAFEKIDYLEKALLTCRLALQNSKDDQELEKRESDLSSSYTIQKGKYGQDGDFTKGVKDLEAQQEMMQKDSLVKNVSYLEKQIEVAREGYLKDTSVPGKINGLVDALLKFEDEAYENEAIDILKKAHTDTRAYQFKMRIGEIHIRQMVRRAQNFRMAGDSENAIKIAKQLLELEIREYTERVANYPTDLGLKFELGRRLFIAGKYDDAIGSLQQAQRDPRNRAKAMGYLGMAFMKKDWWQEAIDTFEKVLDGDVTEEKTKDVRYNLATCYEKTNNLEKAQEHLSHVAQVDFNFKDVRARLETVRKQISEGQS